MVLTDFIRTCIEYEKKHQRFKTFLNLAGIHLHDGKISPGAVSEKERLWELQFQSTDTLLMYLRFLICIRKDSTPYLPDLSDENREEKGAVVSYFEAKHVWLALVAETASEHGITEDNFKDLDTIWEQFLEDSSGKKGAFKVPAIVLSKTSLKDHRKDSESDVKKSKKNYNLKSFEDKNINLDIFLRICINEYVQKRILQMKRLLSCLSVSLTFHNSSLSKVQSRRT